MSKFDEKQWKNEVNMQKIHGENYVDSCSINTLLLF